MPDDELAILLGKRFLERRDVKAVQHPGGSYTPDRTPWKMSDLRNHIEGKTTYGHYMTSPEDKTKLWAFDIDLRQEGRYTILKEDKVLNGGQACNPREVWLDKNHEGYEHLTIQLRCLAESLAIKAHRLSAGEFPIAIAYSGNKGLHVYGFMGTVPAEEARSVAIEVLNSFNCFENSRGENFWVHTNGGYENLEIEVFPKQGSLEGKDLGNLMRLPLGVHRKTGNRAFFIDPTCGYNEIKEMNPLAALSGEQSWE